MKAKKRKEVEKMLKDAGCTLKSNGPHMVWEKATGATFALPHHNEISPGLMRQLTKFLKE